MRSVNEKATAWAERREATIAAARSAVRCSAYGQLARSGDHHALSHAVQARVD